MNDTNINNNFSTTIKAHRSSYRIRLTNKKAIKEKQKVTDASANQSNKYNYLIPVRLQYNILIQILTA